MPRSRRFDEDDEAHIVLRDSQGVLRTLTVEESHAFVAGSYDPVESQASSQEQGEIVDAYHDSFDDAFYDLPEPMSYEDEEQDILGMLDHNLHLVWSSRDKREGHFVSTCFDTETGQMAERGYCFVGVRFVQYQDTEALISWCSDPKCSSHDRCSGASECFNESDFPAVSHSQHLANWEQMCQFSELAVKAKTRYYGKEYMRQSFADSAESQGDGPVIVRLMMDGRERFIVRTSQDFNDWGVTEIRGSHAFCLTCERHKRDCKHALHLNNSMDSDELPLPRLTAQTFQQKLAKEFDFSAGERKLACLSREQIPPDPLPVCTERKRGSSPLPDQVHPDLLQACPLCQNSDWACGDLGPKCTVFLLASAAQIQFPEFCCLTEGCSGKLVADGIELGLLRKSAKYAFAHELLWDWSHRMSTGGVTWYGHWRDTLARYPATTEQKAWWQNRLRDMYEQATLDFIQLQRLDFAAGFSCDCQADLVADGITLGFQANQMFLVSLTDPLVEDTEEPSSSVRGSLFKDRVFIRRADLRRQILEFSRSGLPASSWQQLLISIMELGDDAQEAALLPYLEQSVEDNAVSEDGSEVMHPHPAHRHLFRILGSSAPVCQFVKPAIFNECQRMLSNEHLTAAETIAFAEHCPQLQKFLHEQLNSTPEAKDNALLLLKELLEVSRRCFVPAGEDSLGSQSRRAFGDQSRRTVSTVSGNEALRHPTCWSREEAFLMTGSFSGFEAETWQAPNLGGSDCYRPMRRYAADSHTFGSRGNCTKYQAQHKKLTPGCMLYWCIHCRKCRFFNIMADSESPRTVMQTLLTRWKEPPKSFYFDNGCNVHSYILNREPSHFREMEIGIDEMHYKGHTDCSPCYSTGAYRGVVNSPLAEQKNSFLDLLRSQAAYMKQTTFLWYVRYFLLLLNKQEESPQIWHDRFKNVRYRDAFVLPQQIELADEIASSDPEENA